MASPAGNTLAQLSSRVHDRTARSNLKAASRCLKEPGLLEEIAEGFKELDATLVGDCAEVLTEVARGKPDLVARYAAEPAPLVNHATTRVPWEAMHALAGLAKAVAADPGLRDELGRVWERFADSASGVVRKAARALMQAVKANKEAR